MAGSGSKESFTYIRKFLREEKDENRASQAQTEFKKLLKFESQQIIQPVDKKIDPEKEWNEEQMKDFPFLFDLILEADKKRVANSRHFLTELKTLMDKRKAALMQMEIQDKEKGLPKEPELNIEITEKDKKDESESKTTTEEKGTTPTDQSEDVPCGETAPADPDPSTNVDVPKPPNTDSEQESNGQETAASSTSALKELLFLDKVKEIGELREKALKEYEDLVKKEDAAPTDISKASEEEEMKEKMSTIEYILGKASHVDPDSEPDKDFLRAVGEYRNLQTKEQYLQLPEYAHLNLLDYTTCTVKTGEDVLPFMEEATGYGLLRFLDATDKSVFNDEFTEESMWNEFARLQIADRLLILERKAKGPDLNRYIVVERDEFFAIQEDLKKKTEEVEDLSTRLSRFASNQLTEGNPNIADLSDTHRPTKVGEMFGQLYDDEWSEAFEALKPPQKDEDEEEDEICLDVLFTLQKVVMKAFEYCSTQVKSQMKKLEEDIAGAVDKKPSEKIEETETKAEETSSESTKEEVKEKEEQQENVDQSKEAMNEGHGDVKDKEGEVGGKVQVNQRLKHFVEKQAKELAKGLASFSSMNAANEFVSKELPTIIDGEKCNEERVIAYAKKCIELCWYMNVQDPPMILVALADGDKMNSEQYSYHYRKGKVVELCLWPALFLHSGGPLVAKGHALPKEKGK